MLDVEETTRRGYLSYIDKHIRPMLGGLQVARLDAETLDSFYAAQVPGQVQRPEIRRPPHEPAARVRRPLSRTHLYAAIEFQHLTLTP